METRRISIEEEEQEAISGTSLRAKALALSTFIIFAVLIYYTLSFGQFVTPDTFPCGLLAVLLTLDFIFLVFVSYILFYNFFGYTEESLLVNIIPHMWVADILTSFSYRNKPVAVIISEDWFEVEYSNKKGRRIQFTDIRVFRGGKPTGDKSSFSFKDSKGWHLLLLPNRHAAKRIARLLNRKLQSRKRNQGGAME